MGKTLRFLVFYKNSQGMMYLFGFTRGFCVLKLVLRTPQPPRSTGFGPSCRFRWGGGDFPPSPAILRPNRYRKASNGWSDIDPNFRYWVGKTHHPGHRVAPLKNGDRLSNADFDFSLGVCVPPYLANFRACCYGHQRVEKSTFCTKNRFLQNHFLDLFHDSLGALYGFF